jgi:hypothetical protein
MLVRPPSGKKVLWQEMLRHELLDALDQQPVVIVPVGSIEQHGPHCPMDVDISIPYHLAIRAADAIEDFPVIVAPPVSYGFTHYNMGEVGTITLKRYRSQSVGERVSPHRFAERTRWQPGAGPVRLRQTCRGGCLGVAAHVLEYGPR